MAVSISGGGSNDDDEFIQSSYLTYIVPLATDYRLEQALGQQEEPPRAFFESIEDREWLFFGTAAPFRLDTRIMSPCSSVDC